MTIYNEKNVRKKIFLHFTLQNDKKTAVVAKASDAGNDKVVTHTTFYTF